MDSLSYECATGECGKCNDNHCSHECHEYTFFDDEDEELTYEYL